MPVASRPAPAAQPSSAFQPVPPARQEAKQPSPIPDTADRLPTAPAAPLKVSQPLVTDPAATTPSPIGARKVVPSPPAPARPSAAALAAAARRTQLVQDLVHHFAGSIIQHTVEGPIHRAASLALKERWSAVRAEEARRKRALVEAVAQQTTFELGRLSVRVGIFRGVRDERSRRSAWQEWQRAVQRSLERKARDAELRSGWRNVVGAIVAGSHRYRGDDARDKAVEEEPADDDGIAGSFDLPGLSFGDLSLVAPTAEDGPDKSDRADVEFAGRFLDAADERERIWTRGTFLDIVADAASRALAEEDLAHRPEWTALIATQSTQSPFATWLTCKFDLDPSKLSVEIDTPKADISVKMHADATQPHTQVRADSFKQQINQKADSSRYSLRTLRNSGYSSSSIAPLDPKPRSALGCSVICSGPPLTSSLPSGNGSVCTALSPQLEQSRSTHRVSSSWIAPRPVATNLPRLATFSESTRSRASPPPESTDRSFWTPKRASLRMSRHFSARSAFYAGAS